MGTYIPYSDTIRNKDYKMYFNDITHLVKINDGCYEYVLDFTDDELASNLIKKFEDMLSDRNTDEFFSELKKENIERDRED